MVAATDRRRPGVALLRKGFDDESIGAVGLLVGALAPTGVAVVVFLL